MEAAVTEQGPAMVEKLTDEQRQLVTPLLERLYDLVIDLRVMGATLTPEFGSGLSRYELSSDGEEADVDEVAHGKWLGTLVTFRRISPTTPGVPAEWSLKRPADPDALETALDMVMAIRGFRV